MNTAQTALFRAMLYEGWFTDSDGHVDSPTGYFGYMINTEYELKEIFEVFSDTVEAYGKPSNSEIIGSWFAVIDSNGIIHIKKMDNDTEARELFLDSQNEYAQTYTEPDYSEFG